MEHIIGHGVDVVDVERFARVLARHGRRFERRCFVPAEISYAEASRRRAEHLAARFAAKEAVAKALGTGLFGGIALRDIEVTRDAHGRPGIRLAGQADRRAKELRIARWLVSLSHTESVAVASVLGLGDGDAHS